MATSGDDFKYDGQVTIQLTRHGDEISVWPSNELKGGLAISLMDVEEPRTNVGIATPAEWDAFVAAGNAALGRPGPGSTPLEASLLAAIEAAGEHVEQGWSLGVEDADLNAARGRVEGLRAALAMAREAGPTVPRVAVADVVPLLAGVSTILADSDDTEAKREAVRRLDRIIVALGRMVTDGPTPTEGR